MGIVSSFVPNALASLLVAAAACTTQVGGPDGMTDIDDMSESADVLGPDAGFEPEPDAFEPFDGPCGEGDAHFEASDGTCYEYFFEESSWAGARLKCEFLGGDLARIDDAATNGILSSIVPSAFPEAWLLGSDEGSEGVWSWDGDAMSYGNWQPGQPDNANGIQNCLILQANQGGTWDDRNCNDRMSYICQR